MQQGDSLKSKLFEAIKSVHPNMFSIERAELLARENGYKISNYERRCRELCEMTEEQPSPPVRMIRNERGYIIGYIYQEKKPINIPVNPVQNSLFTHDPKPYQ